MKFLDNIKGSLILAVASLIWGLAFVAQAQAADMVPPFAFNSIRCFIGALALFAVLGLKSIKTKKPIFPTEKAKIKEVFEKETKLKLRERYDSTGYYECSGISYQNICSKIRGFNINYNTDIYESVLKSNSTMTIFNHELKPYKKYNGKVRYI